jgi:hypothetical protein
MNSGVAGEWPADGHGNPCCGECGQGYSGEISSHAEDCTVRHAMHEAWDEKYPEEAARLREFTPKLQRREPPRIRNVMIIQEEQ